MKKKKYRRCVVPIVLAILMMLTGCSTSTASTTTDTAAGSSDSDSSASSGSGQTVIKIAFATNGYPIEYMDENNNPTGCDIDTMKAVDDLLDDYTFEYYQADQDAVYSGLEAGTYDIALTNAFYTEDRAEKYILPENPLGAAVVGIIVNNDNPDIKTIEDCYNAGLSVAPTIAGDGLWYVLYDYNQNNPDKQIDIQVTNSISAFSDTVSWVAEGRCGFGIWPKYYWDSMVEAEDGGLHEYADSVYFSECMSTKTYTVIRSDLTDLASEINTALGELYDNGTLEKNSENWYGYNTFAYLNS